MGTSMEVAKSCRLTARTIAKAKSEWNAELYAVPGVEGSFYLNELDVVALLDPPKELIPLDPSSYNPASYLWLVLLIFLFIGFVFIHVFLFWKEGKIVSCVE